MSGDIMRFIEEQKLLLIEEQKRLGINNETKKNDASKGNHQIEAGMNINKTEINKNNNNNNNSKNNKNLLNKLHIREENDKENFEPVPVIQKANKEFDNKEKNLEIHKTQLESISTSTTTDSEKLNTISLKNINSEAPFLTKPDGSSLERYPSSCFNDNIDYKCIDERSPDTAYIPSRLSILQCHQHQHHGRRSGEYSPSNYARLRATPHTGLGEYECTQDLFDAQDSGGEKKGIVDRWHCYDREGDHSVNKDLVEKDCEIDRAASCPDSNKSSNRAEIERSDSIKSVQTDIKNIGRDLVQYDWQPTESETNRLLTDNSLIYNKQQRTVTDNLVDAALINIKRPFPHFIDQRLTSEQNELLFLKSRPSTVPLTTAAVATVTNMDKPKSILSNRRTGSPRDRYPVDYSQSAYVPTTYMDGFSYTDRSEELERERLKREAYQRDLRQQIEEKRQMQVMREEQDRRERELENKRLEQQMLRIQEEQVVEEQRRARRSELMRRHSDDFLRRRTELHEMQRPIWQRRHADSESANLDTLGSSSGGSGLGASSGLYHQSSSSSSYYTSPGGGNYYPGGSHYSPPISRRLPSYSSYNVPGTFADSNATRYSNQNRFEASNSAAYCPTAAAAAGGGCGSGDCRKDPLSRINSLNSYDTVPLGRSSHRSKFDRFDSLSRIDSLSHRLETTSIRDGLNSDLTDLHRRHSATQQDLSLLRKSPRLRRRNSSSRFEMDPLLPVPMLKARSPVAKELRNAIPFSSQIRNNEIQRRYEDRWQAPSSVQKNYHHSIIDSTQQNRSGNANTTTTAMKGGSILTQLGSIRAQLQREQLRMDESLRRRKLNRARSAIDDY